MFVNPNTYAHLPDDAQMIQAAVDAAVYFEGDQARNMFFDGIITDPAGQPAIAGYGEVDGEARSIRTRGTQPKMKGNLKIEILK